MKSAGEIFDACIVCFTDIRIDARSVNLARAIVRNGKKVCIIAPGDNNEAHEFEKEGIVFKPVKIDSQDRVLIRWIRFILQVNKFRHIQARTYWASDLYSLYNSKQFSEKHNGRLFYDSREIYSSLGPLAGNSMKQQVISLIEKRLVPYVEGMIVSGELDAEYLKNYFGHNTPYHIIKNLPPFRNPEENDLIRKQYFIPHDNIILLYQGVILKGRGLMPFVKALKFIDKAVIFIIGDGEYQSEIQAEAEKQGVANRVIFHGRVPYDELHSWTCSADLGLVFNQPITLSYQMALPNKLFEYCMAGLPSLVSDIPAQRKVIEESGIGIIIPADATAGEIADYVKKIHSKKYRQPIISRCIENAGRYAYESQDKLINSLFE